MSLREIRKSKGLTLPQMAEIVGVHHTHLSRIETGKITPSLKIAFKIAAGYDITIERLRDLLL